MLELVKAIAEWAGKIASSAIQRHRNAQRVGIGTDLLVIAYEVAEIAICGRALLDLLERKQQAINERSMSSEDSSNLLGLVQEQVSRVFVLSAMIHNQRRELYAVDPSARASVLFSLDEGKTIFLNNLIGEFRRVWHVNESGWEPDGKRFAFAHLSAITGPESAGPRVENILDVSHLPRQREIVHQLEQLGSLLRQRIVDVFDVQSLLLELRRRKSAPRGPFHDYDDYRRALDSNVFPSEAELLRFANS